METNQHSVPEPNPYQKGDKVEYTGLNENNPHIGYYSYRSGRNDYVIPFFSYQTPFQFEVVARVIQKINVDIVPNLI